MSFWKELFDVYQQQLQSRRLEKGASRALVQELKTNLCLLAEALQVPGASHGLIAGLSDSAFRHYCQQGYEFSEFSQKKLATSTTANIAEFNQYLQQSTADLIYRAYQRTNVLKAFCAAHASKNSRRRIQSLLRYHIMLIAHLQSQTLQINP